MGLAEKTAAAESGPAPLGRTLRRMRLLAGLLLFAMAALYAVSVLNHANGPAWGYARAFAEAALVGGLADWFAVTAIFRRPLGLPIPHTAVIPRSKARIADALGEFVAVNFLAPDVVRARLATIDIAGGLARQIVQPQTARRVADGVIDALPGIVDLLDDAVVGDFLRRQLAQLGADTRLATAFGRGLHALTEHGSHQPLLDAALTEGWRALEDHENAIRSQVRQRTGWLWRIIALDARAADALIGAIEDTLRAVARDRDHPLRQRVTEILRRFADELQHSPELGAQIEKILAEVLAHPSVDAFLDEVSVGLKQSIARLAASPDSTARDALAEAIAGFADALLADAAVQEALNRRLRVLMVELAARHGRDAALLISETVRGWDADTVVAKLEQNVGPDLQYIRINGTLIGGLIGLAIHQTTLCMVGLKPPI